MKTWNIEGKEYTAQEIVELANWDIDISLVRNRLSRGKITMTDLISSKVSASVAGRRSRQTSPWNWDPTLCKQPTRLETDSKIPNGFKKYS